MLSSWASTLPWLHTARCNGLWKPPRSGRYFLFVGESLNINNNNNNDTLCVIFDENVWICGSTNFWKFEREPQWIRIDSGFSGLVLPQLSSTNISHRLQVAMFYISTLSCLQKKKNLLYGMEFWEHRLRILTADAAYTQESRDMSTRGTYCYTWVHWITTKSEFRRTSIIWKKSTIYTTNTLNLDKIIKGCWREAPQKNQGLLA